MTETYIDYLNNSEGYDTFEEDVESNRLYEIDQTQQNDLRNKLNCHNYPDFIRHCKGAIRVSLDIDAVGWYEYGDLRQVHGGTVYDEWTEFKPCSWYVIGDPDFAKNHTNEFIFFYTPLNCYLWADVFGHADDSEYCPGLH